MNASQGEGGLPNYLWWQFYDNKATISIKVYHNTLVKKETDYSFEGNGSYYNGRLNIIRLPNVNTCNVEIVFSTPNSFIVLPTVIIPLYGHRDNICVSTNEVDRPNFSSQERYGVQCYDLTSRVLQIWDGQDWYNALGVKASVTNHGTFAKRPAAADIHIGFQYFNTDTHRTITWSGKKWYNPDGTEATQ